MFQSASSFAERFSSCGQSGSDKVTLFVFDFFLLFIFFAIVINFSFSPSHPPFLFNLSSYCCLSLIFSFSTNHVPTHHNLCSPDLLYVESLFDIFISTFKRQVNLVFLTLKKPSLQVVKWQQQKND